MFGVVLAAERLLAEGRLGSIVDAVLVKTEDELLDQASALLGISYLAAAAVITGGALETHLKHLVEKHGLTVTGAGNIAKYDGAIAQARNSVFV